MQQIAIFGGTFDPVHWGHLLIAQTALSQVNLEKVIWIPTRKTRHKQATLFEHRWEMVRQAIALHPAFMLLPVEGDRRGSFYAINILIELQALYPNTHWYWILGLDTFQTLPRWYQRRELAAECDWLVAPRATVESNFTCEQVVQQLAAQEISIRWQLLQMPLVGVSASLIRQYCHDGRSIRCLVPEVVREYIANNNLYSR